MLHNGPSLILTDPPMTYMILPQISQSRFGLQPQGLAISLPRFMVPPSTVSLAMPTIEQKSSERFVQLAPLKFDGTPGDRAYGFLSECQG